MKPCFGYIRVSTQKQGEGVSLEAQKDAITGFASRHELNIIKWFEEKQTAAKGGRPKFNQMLRQLKRGAAKGVVIHKIDRAARNPRDWAMFSELPDIGVDVFVATESLDFNSRGGRLTADIQAVIAADYIRNLREETIKGLNGRLKQGLYPFRAPIGYLDNGRGQPKTPDPKKAPLIREMFELYAGGQYSLRSLQAEITRRGLRNLNDQPLTLHGVETILNNTFYTGLITIARTGATYDGTHERIVPAKLFQRVQDIKAGRSGPKVTRHNHLFQGLFRCGLCQGPMSPERQKGRCYYRCQRQGCPTATMREDRLEEAIVYQLRKLQLEPELADHLEAAWMREGIDRGTEDRASAVRLQIADEEKRLDRLTDLVIDGTIDNQTYRERQRSGRLRLTELEENLANLPDADAIEQNRRDFLELMKTLCLLYEMADPPEKREIVENAFSNRVVAGKNVELEPYDWLTRHKSMISVLECDPERYTDTDMAGVPAGVGALQRLIEYSRSRKS
ncbi:recombinase family protein [Thiosulfatihalobacter marinus]|uniref:recombinase family protein n=1 Tax=Thiosulfatihalobacter marinus TaxID=2792481 RepID=UPI001E338DE6|nr:recombinase family protein [Thiosulfatihalobacter marinus]